MKLCVSVKLGTTLVCTMMELSHHYCINKKIDLSVCSVWTMLGKKIRNRKSHQTIWVLLTHSSLHHIFCSEKHFLCYTMEKVRIHLYTKIEKFFGNFSNTTTNFMKKDFSAFDCVWSIKYKHFEKEWIIIWYGEIELRKCELHECFHFTHATISIRGPLIEEKNKRLRSYTVHERI